MTSGSTSGERAGRGRADEIDPAVRELLDHGRVVDAPQHLSADRDEVLERIAAERGLGAWTRSRTTGFRHGIWVALLVSGALLVTKRPDLGVYPPSYLVPGVLAFAVLALWAVLFALRPLYRPAPGRRAVGLLSAALVVAPLAFALLPEAYSARGGSSPVPADALPAAWQCFVFGTLVGTPFAALGWFLDRGGLAAGGRLLLVSLAAAAVGSLLLLLHCPNTDPVHLLTGHASVMIPALVLVAVVAGWRRRGPRPTDRRMPGS